MSVLNEIGFTLAAKPNAFVVETPRLKLVPKSLPEVRAQIEAMDADQRAELSADWLAQLDRPAVDVWTLGFTIILRASDTDIGTCGFKGPPGVEGIVEIAYGLTPDQEGHGYATEAAAALWRTRSVTRPSA